MAKKSIPHHKPLYGIGVNDADYITRPKVNGKVVYCPYFQVWKGIFTRCYNQKFLAKQPTYMGCSVDERWHSFMAFRYWMKQQEWDELHLDKDIIVPGNKIYSPETCVFVTKDVNSLLNANTKIRGKWPQGVAWHKASMKFIANLSVRKKRVHLGLFEDPSEAHSVYLQAKAAHIREIAMEQKDTRVRDGLLLHAELYAKGKI